MMATSKRIPKRSIIGCRVSVETRDDGIWRHGRVVSIRSETMFSVRLEHNDQVVDHHESRILGPGFLTCLPPDSVLRSGQVCFVTHNGREVEGVVTQHTTDQDCVEVEVKDIGLISKKLEDIRLMESRKSARLVNTDTDFSLLADFNIVEQRKLAQETSSSSQPFVSSRRRLHSMSDFLDRKHQRSDQERREVKRRQRSERQSASKMMTGSIEVPGSRKRRTSESRAEADSGYGSSFGSGFFRTEENLSECTAAMVLMNLSVSPRDKKFHFLSGDSDQLTSPPPITPRPSPAVSLSHLSEDEEPYKRARQADTRVRYQCTWRGCGRMESCQQLMEKHVREHLGLPDPAPGTDYGGEEDFYYTEIEMEDSPVMEMDAPSDSGCSSSSNDGIQFQHKFQSSEATSSPSKSFIQILPHQSMSPSSLASSVPSNFGSTFSQSGAGLGPTDQSQQSNHLLDHIGMARPSYEAPTTIYVVNTTNPPHNNANSWHGKKLVSIVPKTDNTDNSQETYVFKSSQSVMKSDKKCRKVYGIEQKDLWCTQCKWKKACGRFT